MLFPDPEAPSRQTKEAVRTDSETSRTAHTSSGGVANLRPKPRVSTTTGPWLTGDDGLFVGPNKVQQPPLVAQLLSSSGYVIVACPVLWGMS